MPQPLDMIRALASKYPEAEKTCLLGDHEVFRVRKKVFVWFGENDEGGTYLSVKLKDSQHAAMMLPFVKPAGYGMAKWGWIEAQFPKGKLPLELVTEWIAESYRHTAPRKLQKQLGSDHSPTPPKKARARTAARAKRH